MQHGAHHRHPRDTANGRCTARRMAGPHKGHWGHPSAQPPPPFKLRACLSPPPLLGLQATSGHGATLAGPHVAQQRAHVVEEARRVLARAKHGTESGSSPRHDRRLAGGKVRRTAQRSCANTEAGAATVPAHNVWGDTAPHTAEPPNSVIVPNRGRRPAARLGPNLPMRARHLLHPTPPALPRGQRVLLRNAGGPSETRGALCCAEPSPTSPRLRLAGGSSARWGRLGPA